MDIKNFITTNLKWIVVGSLTIFTLSVGVIYKPNMSKITKTIFGLSNAEVKRITEGLREEKEDKDKKLAMLQKEFNALQSQKDRLQRERNAMTGTVNVLESKIKDLQNKSIVIPGNRTDLVKAFNALGYSTTLKNCGE